MRLHSNKYVEALLYVTIPLAVHVALTPRLLRRTLRHTKALVLGHPDKGYIVREITATTTFQPWGAMVSKTDQPNHLLQRALTEFLTDKMQLERDRANTVYQLLDKTLDDQLTTRKARPEDDDVAATSDAGTDDVESGADSNDEDDEPFYRKKEYSYEQLLQLRVAAAPAAETWARVAPGVFFQYVVTGAGDSPDDADDASQDDKYTRRVTVTFRLRSKRADASQAIDALVQQAFFEFKKRQIFESAQDTTRYMFVQTIKEQPKPPAGGHDGADGAGKSATSTIKTLAFKRYPLGEGKSFKNLFFKDKPRVLHLLDNFTQRRGKFAVRGFPYKLGLLLHGPPGTGKTSLIKAVAQYTKRHIVSISLAKIKTNQELMDAVFTLRFPIDGRATPMVLDFQDVVFVMEDIDCAGASVVHARDTSEEQENKAQPRRRMAAATQPNDKLNLSGLLNVLDGVIDCPGRIVIMTTNHPEKLDPALIRPGRVNAQLLLGPMAAPQVVEMLEYYFSASLTPTEREQIEEATRHVAFSPAQVEEICADHDTLDDAVPDASIPACLRTGHSNLRGIEMPFTSVCCACERTLRGLTELLVAVHDHLLPLAALGPRRARRVGGRRLVALWHEVTAVRGVSLDQYTAAALLAAIQANGMAVQAPFALEIAAAGGNLALVEWIHANAFGGGAVTRHTLPRAVAKGHQDVVQWLVLATQRRPDYETVMRHAMDEAARVGHLRLLQWLCRNCHFWWSTHALGAALLNGFVDVASWMPAVKEERLCTYAYGGGHDPSLPDPDLSAEALVAFERGDLRVLDWLRERGGLRRVTNKHTQRAATATCLTTWRPTTTHRPSSLSSNSTRVTRWAAPWVAHSGVSSAVCCVIRRAW